MSLHKPGALLSATFAFVLSLSMPAMAQQQGVTAATIRVGATTDLEGDLRNLGRETVLGVRAALGGVRFRGRDFDYRVINDFYSPERAVEGVETLLEEGVFVMLGSMGSPTARQTLPVLARNGVPAVGFVTGAGFLRPGPGDIVNFRPSYAQEVATVVRAALAAGLRPTEICAYAQNDAYGMSAVEGFRDGIEGQPGAGEIVPLLERILAMEGDDPPRNYMGPVGVFTRNTLSSAEGYDSLKTWEALSGTPCRLVVTGVTDVSGSRFAGYVNYKGEDWVLSMISVNGVEDFTQALREHGIGDNIILTRVVPPLDSPLPIAADARRDLGERLTPVSFEGYIVGRMFLAILDSMEGPITRDNFLDAVEGRRFELRGLELDFTDDNQGSDLVSMSLFDGSDFRTIEPQDVKALFAD